MKRFVIILMALALGLSVSAQRGRYSKGRKPVRTTQRVAPRPVTTIKTCPDDNHPHAIDLGLPSGTKWACCNVGASKPTAYGNYYAWGETSPKANYDFDTYKWSKSSYFYTKYCTDSESGWNGFTDGKEVLDLEDDAADANWGGEWRMPDYDDFEELIEHTTNKWVKNFNGAGVKGYLFTSKNSKQIFIPAAGICQDTLYGVGSEGDYWTSSLFTDGPSNACNLSFSSYDMNVEHGVWCRNRYDGLTVRPVHR